MELPPQVRSRVAIAARSDANVLITGPTGVGKTSLARLIHEASARRLRPFVTVNLASLHEGTLESELFGHERGAFTGADHRRLGRLEAAQGGTVFLDEIGELSPRLQARLLEFLQSRIVSPVGSNREVRLDVRVVAATHRDLDRSITRGEFREDLFHRLRLVMISLQPLVERSKIELERLIQVCLAEVSGGAGGVVPRLSAEALGRIGSHAWPGNVRELRSVLEYAVLACSGPEIGLEDLPDWFLEESSSTNRPTLAPVLGVAELPLSLDFHDCLERFEKEYLERALRRFQSRINLTARSIGLNKTTLIRRLRDHGIRTGPLDGLAQNQLF